MWKTSALQSFSGKEQEIKRALITVTKSNNKEDLDKDFQKLSKKSRESSFIFKSESKASETLIVEMMVRTIQGAPSTAAARTDHAPLGPAPALHLPEPHCGPGAVASRAAACWTTPWPEHLGLSTPSSKPGHPTWVRQGRDTQAEVKALLCPAVVALQWQSCFPALLMFT